MFQGNELYNISSKAGVNRKKFMALMVSLVLLLTVAVGGTLAFLMTKTDPVENTFLPSKVTTAVSENITTEDGIKKDVKIQNTGDTDAYIRAAVVVTWQDAAGNVYGRQPVEGTDYLIDWYEDDQKVDNDLVNSDWIKGADGFYYHKAVVTADPDGNGSASGGVTAVLFTSCSPISNAAVPEDYKLTVEILASGVQSDGMSVDQQPAVAKAWNSDKITITIDDKKNLVVTAAGGNSSSSDTQ